MQTYIKLWTFLAVLTICSCNSKENRKEIVTDIIQKEKASDPKNNANDVVVPKENKSIEEAELDNSFTVSNLTDLNEEIKIALTGVHRKNESYLSNSENGKQWYGVFLNMDAPHEYKIISTVIHIIDTILEDDVIQPEHVIISTDENNDNWDSCLFLFKGIKVSLKQEKKQFINYAFYLDKSLRMFPGEAIYDIKINEHYFDLYVEGSFILDSNEKPKNQNCDSEYFSDNGVNINNYSIFLLQSIFQAGSNSLKMEKHVLLPRGDYCSLSIPSITFIGDIDGDDIPDFVLASYSMNTNTVLYLSSKGFKKVASFEQSYGC